MEWSIVHSSARELHHLPPNLSLMACKSSHYKTPSSLRGILISLLPPVLIEWLSHFCINAHLHSSWTPPTSGDVPSASHSFPATPPQKTLYSSHAVSPKLSMLCTFVPFALNAFPSSGLQFQMFPSAADLTCPPSSLSATTEFSCFHPSDLTIFVTLRHCIYHDALY